MCYESKFRSPSAAREPIISVLNSLVDLVCQPGNLLLIVLVLGVLLLAFGRRRSGGTLLGVVTLAALAIAILPVVDWVSAPLENRFPRAALPPHIDGIVLLGGAIRLAMTEAHGEVALNNMAERITETLALAHRYPGVPIVVSGGSNSAVKDTNLTEAAAMRTLLVEDGVAPDRIVVEGRARNTYENAVFSQQVAQPQPGQIWVLVTSANHMPRAVGCFRKVGWSVLPDPVDYHSAPSPSLEFNFGGNLDALTPAVHEWIGLVAYRLLGRIDQFFPGPAKEDANG